MRKATLTRNPSTDYGTFGNIVTDSGFSCRTGELPWRDNKKKRSCIPAGVYVCEWDHSPAHGMCYHVRNVPGRSGILFHAANLMGDEEKGFRSELEGCIAPGLRVDEFKGQLALLHSRRALLELEEDLGQEPFELTIV